MAPQTRSAEGGSQQLRARKRISYRETDSSSDISDQVVEGSSDESASVDDLPPRWRRRRPSANPSPSRCLTKSPNKRRAPPSRANARLTHAKKARSDKTPECDEERSDAVSDAGEVPPWQSLPYHILAQIFLCASPQLWTEDFTPTASIQWLLKCALLCRAFAEPALSALYYSPPLTPPSRARGLIDCLGWQTENTAFNYRSKVKYLDIEAETTLRWKYKGRDPINLGDLVHLTPQLRGLRIHVMPRGNYMIHTNSNSKSIYQPSTFTALQFQRIALQEWIWNAELGGQRYLASKLGEIHSTSAFQSLRSLTFIKYDEKHSTAEELSDAIKTLPQLKRLVFRLSLVVNEKLLPLLPRQLESLEIVSCPSLTSPVLSSFLSTHGQEILHLILDHNQALSLSFLTDFAVTCPKIQTLRMNLRFYSTHSAFADLDPKFDTLLLEDETPTWPASLAYLDLLHLRKWNLNIAERFFLSLVGSAASLPKLRRLNIKASLEESGWRDRVSFRDKWTSRLQLVFLRVSEPPSPHLNSIAAFKAHKEQLLARTGNVEDHKLGGNSRQQRPALRLVAPKQSSKFSHVAIREVTPTSKATVKIESDSDAPLVTIRRSGRIKQKDASHPTRRTKRIRGSDESSSSEPENDDEDEYVSPKTSSSLYRRRPRRRKKESDESSSSEDSALDDDAAGERAPEGFGLFRSKHEHFHIQGLCDVVHVLIDNLRPMEEQLNEGDFLDDEPSGDEDWNGDSDIGETGYAW